MSKILCLILILFATSWAYADHKVQVSISSGEALICTQQIKSEFWVCDGKRLLFIGDTIVGQVPTLHHLEILDVKVPLRIFDLKTNKELYSNSQNFQYQQAQASTHQWVGEVFGPNQKAVVTHKFSEEELAAKAQVAVSLSDWQMYPQYISTANTQPSTEKETSANIEDARMIIEELGL